MYKKTNKSLINTMSMRCAECSGKAGVSFSLRFTEYQCRIQYILDKK